MSRSTKVNLAVCGKFHTLNYASKLDNLGALNRLYFSHKLATGKASGVSSNAARNFPLKEYLTQGHTRLLRYRGYNQALLAYHYIWESQVLCSWVPAPILHILCQGAGNRIIRRAHKDAGKVLCEVLNTHPINRYNVLKKESEIWGVRWKRAKLYERELRLIDEVSQSDRLLAPSAHVAQTFKAHGIDKPVSILPYAANLSRFYPCNERGYGNEAIRNKPLRIISVGQIGLRKGQLHILKALEEFGSSAELTLLGSIDPDVEPILRRYRDRFTHIQQIPNSSVPDLLMKHDVYISASLEEGLAVSICEAMAMGMAVIATHESGANEVIETGIEGLLYEGGNQPQLQGHIASLLNNPEMVFKLGSGAIEKTRNLVNWDSYTIELYKIYSELIGQDMVELSQ